MIKREDFNGKQYPEMVEAMQADLVLYKDRINSMTYEECLAEEQVLMASMDEIKEQLNNVTYELPLFVMYDNKKYTKKDIACKIVYILNKLEVKWEQTLGLYQLVSIWKNEDLKNIPYNVYDSTLRCLNQVTFKGYTEWADILAVNEYLSSCHNEYSLDTGILLYMHECHNIVMNHMKEINPASDVPEDMSDAPASDIEVAE